MQNKKLKINQRLKVNMDKIYMLIENKKYLYNIILF